MLCCLLCYARAGSWVRCSGGLRSKGKVGARVARLRFYLTSHRRTKTSVEGTPGSPVAVVAPSPMARSPAVHPKQSIYASGRPRSPGGLSRGRSGHTGRCPQGRHAAGSLISLGSLVCGNHCDPATIAACAHSLDRMCCGFFPRCKCEGWCGRRARTLCAKTLSLANIRRGAWAVCLGNSVHRLRDA